MITAVTDKFQKHSSKSGGEYWRFNVYIEDLERDYGVMSMGWMLREYKLQAPYDVIGGKFYTNMRVTKPIAKAIYIDAIRRVGELEGRVIPFNDKNWKAPTLGQSSFERTLPNYHQEKYGKPEIISSPEVVPPSISVVDWDISPYPEYLDFNGMNNTRLRPSFIPKRIWFEDPDHPVLHWGRKQWEAHERSKDMKASGTSNSQ